MSLYIEIDPDFGFIFKCTMYLNMMFAHETHNLYWFLEFTLLQLSSTCAGHEFIIVSPCLYFLSAEIYELLYDS